MERFLKAVIFIAICESVGIIGSFFTFSSITEWYLYLQKPSFSPPNWIFGPVWTLLYFLMGLSAFLVWEVRENKKNVRDGLQLFAIQLFFNFTWSILFFGLRSPLLGLINIIALLLFIILTYKAFLQIKPLAAFLLIPYILWVSFATLLNFSILILNK